MLDTLRRQGMSRPPSRPCMSAPAPTARCVSRKSSTTTLADVSEIPQTTARAIAATRCRAGGWVIAVGTTSLRALESAAAANGAVPGSAAPRRDISRPATASRLVDRLITNSTCRNRRCSCWSGLRRLRRHPRRPRPCRRRALSLLQLRRRDAARWLPNNAEDGRPHRCGQSADVIGSRRPP